MNYGIFITFAVESINSMDYEEISIIAGRIIGGTAKITRLDPEEERGRIAGGRRNVEATLVLGTTFAAHQGKQSGSCFNLNDLSALQKGELKQYAEYVEQEGEKLWYSGVDFEFLDDRISLYNYLFPETSYELVGFTDNPFDDNFISFIVRQKEIEGATLLRQLKTVARYLRETRKEVENKLQEAIIRHLKEKFDANPAYTSNTYSNSNYIIRDLHFENVMAVGNVLTNPQEHLYIIDANVSLNTDKINGGTREYQPFKINK